MMRAFVGLGSNLNNPIEQVKQAMCALDNIAQINRINTSYLYSSAPMGPQDQPDYINAVVELETELSSHALLDTLQAIETQQGRTRHRHWGERTLDLDLLLYNDEQISSDRLQVPHPGMGERNFVLYPLFEIAPELEIPDLGLIKDLISSCEKGSLQRIEEAKI